MALGLPKVVAKREVRTAQVLHTRQYLAVSDGRVASKRDGQPVAGACVRRYCWRPLQQRLVQEQLEELFCSLQATAKASDNWGQAGRLQRQRPRGESRKLVKNKKSLLRKVATRAIKAC